MLQEAQAGTPQGDAVMAATAAAQINNKRAGPAQIDWDELVSALHKGAVQQNGIRFQVARFGGLNVSPYFVRLKYAEGEGYRLTAETATGAEYGHGLDEAFPQIGGYLNSKGYPASHLGKFWYMPGSDDISRQLLRWIQSALAAEGQISDPVRASGWAICMDKLT